MPGESNSGPIVFLVDYTCLVLRIFLLPAFSSSVLLSANFL